MRRILTARSQSGLAWDRTAPLAALLVAIAWLLAPLPAARADTSPAMPASVRAAVLQAEQQANVAIAVLDTQTGDYYGSIADETQYPSESVVKVLIAARLLASGQMTGAVEQQAYQMITESDDDDADALWGQVGGPDVVGWAENRYGITDLGAAPTEYGWWGNTKITAHGIVALYAAIERDPQVGPWLLDAMGHMTTDASDGTDQSFGLASQTTAGSFKQGWGGDDDAFDSEQLNSTGVLDGGRYAVALLVQHVPYESMSELIPVIDQLAAAVDPSGQVVPPAGDPGAGQDSGAGQNNSAVQTPSPAPASGAAGPAATGAGSPVRASAAQPGVSAARPGASAAAPAPAHPVPMLSAASLRRLARDVRHDAVFVGAGLVVLSATVAGAVRRRRGAFARGQSRRLLRSRR